MTDKTKKAELLALLAVHSHVTVSVTARFHIQHPECKLLTSTSAHPRWRNIVLSKRKKKQQLKNILTETHQSSLNQTSRSRCSLPVPAGALSASLTQRIDGGTDLESGTQFDVHGGDEVVLSQQQQGLSVDFLRQELSRQLFATWPQTRGR